MQRSRENTLVHVAQRATLFTRRGYSDSSTYPILFSEFSSVPQLVQSCQLHAIQQHCEPFHCDQAFCSNECLKMDCKNTAKL